MFCSNDLIKRNNDSIDQYRYFNNTVLYWTRYDRTPCSQIFLKFYRFYFHSYNPFNLMSPDIVPTVCNPWENMIYQYGYAGLWEKKLSAFFSWVHFSEKHLSAFLSWVCFSEKHLSAFLYLSAVCETHISVKHLNELLNKHLDVLSEMFECAFFRSIWANIFGKYLNALL